MLALRVILIIGIMSSVGLVTGFFLKHLDSVLKAVASALEAGEDERCIIQAYRSGGVMQKKG